MSQANVELVRGLIPGPDVDIAALMRDDGLATGLLAFVHGLVAPDLECVIAFPGRQASYSGIDGLREAWLDWLEPFEAYFTRIEELTDQGDTVVALVRDRGFRKDVAEPIEQICGAIWTVREDKVTRIEFYTTRADMFEAAGIDAAARHE